MPSIRKNLPDVDPKSVPVISTPSTAGVNIEQKSFEGLEDSVKDNVKEGEKAKQKLAGLLDVSQKVLFRTKTSFPFIFFPTEIVIDLTKITLINEIFFGSQTVHTSFIANITDVMVHHNFFFATLEIVDIGYKENTIKIKHLPIKDAQKARRIIQGLVITKRQDVDLSRLNDFSAEELVAKMEILGTPR